jgi:acyl-CoA synthetase (AMP-forming)/AMP-acid ligase II
MTTLVQHVAERAAAERGDAVALEDGAGDRRTFAELWQRAQALAAGLRDLGLRPGDRVLEALPNSCALVECDLALAVAGLVRVPLNPRLGAREWAAIAADSGASALVVADGLTGADGEPVERHVDVARVVRAGDREAMAASGATFEHRADADDLVGLAYSSGTTGRPKGARRTHRMRVASARAMRAHVVPDAGPGSTYLHAGPAIHTSGLFVLPMLEAGARQLLVDHPRPVEIATLVRARGVTHLALVPTVVTALAGLPEVSPEWFSSVRVLAYAGAPMPAEQLRRAHERLTPRLVQYYGLVEAMPPLSVLGVADHERAVTGEDALATSAGRVLPTVEVRVDPETGEVAARGDVVTPGYWNAERRDDLGKSFEDGWLLTGDVGRLEDGYLWLTDRRGDVVISGGYNIYPREVEEAVATAPGVVQCAAVGLPDPLWGQRLVVAVVGELGDPEAVVARACVGLAPHKRPKEVHVLPELPLGATGKIDRRAVARLLQGPSGH